ncbi:MAG: rRNA maturation RNase YbeY [Candidatus Moranbacteria bacterium]|nr:rRNA maturation RNase YbeY [Candidatus Moranbacteria bacterium]
MNIILEINNKSDCFFESIDLDRVIKSTIKEGEFDFLDERDVEISIGFISEVEIEKINEEYRKVKKPTDVLSFPNYDSLSELKKSKEQSVFLGEILICCEDIKKYAKIKGSFFEEELIYVISHGTLHLLGMEHGKKMFSIQDKVVNMCSLNKK